MTPALAIFDVADTFEDSDCVGARDRGKLRHTATSTNSSSIDGGIASSWAPRLSR
jgi:hypothetical protein